MPDDRDTAVTLARLEGKIDTLAVKVDAGDKASASLVELVKNEVAGVRTVVDGLRNDLREQSRTTDRAISKVRTDLEDRLDDHDEKFEKQSSLINKLIGGVMVVGGLGVPGIVALIRGLHG